MNADRYPNGATLSHLLSWSHWIELLQEAVEARAARVDEHLKKMGVVWK